MLLAALAAVIMMTACGKAEQTATAQQQGSLSAAAPASADVPKSNFPTDLKKPNCSVKVDKARYSGPDILDLRLGMTREEALAVAFCPRKEFNVYDARTYFAVDTFNQTLDAQVIKLDNSHEQACVEMKPGVDLSGVDARSLCNGADTTWTPPATQAIALATPGLRGQEKLTGLSRFESFSEPSTPDKTTAAFTAKFGAPSVRADINRLSWAWTPSGAKLAASDPQVEKCADAAMQATNVTSGSFVGPDFFGLDGKNLAECGRTIVAFLIPVSDNPKLTSGYNIAMIDQAATRALAFAMQDYFKNGDQAAKQQAVDKAASGSKPNL